MITDYTILRYGEVPERNLIASVLFEAVHDAANAMNPNIRTEAREWILESKVFDAYCSFLDLDPVLVRNNITENWDFKTPKLDGNGKPLTERAKATLEGKKYYESKKPCAKCLKSGTVTHKKFEHSGYCVQCNKNNNLTRKLQIKEAKLEDTKQ